MPTLSPGAAFTIYETSPLTLPAYLYVPLAEIVVRGGACPAEPAVPVQKAGPVLQTDTCSANSSVIVFETDSFVTPFSKPLIRRDLMSPTTKAKECFQENLNLFIDLRADPEKHNLYAGLYCLAEALAEIEKRLALLENAVQSRRP